MYFIIEKLLRLCCELCLNQPSALTSRAKSLGVFLVSYHPKGRELCSGNQAIRPCGTNRQKAHTEICYITAERNYHLLKKIVTLSIPFFRGATESVGEKPYIVSVRPRACVKEKNPNNGHERP